MTAGITPSDGDGTSPALKHCPWCGGGLVFTPAFPVIRLAAGEIRRIPDEGVPAALRGVPAWTCSTPYCKYREPA